MKANPIKVLAFDSWTGGAHNYERLVKAFEIRGMELVLVHLGSWGSDEGRRGREMIGTLQVRDISIFKKKSLTEIIDVETPSAVIFLSLDAFAHRAFNRYCHHRQLPTMHLFCGILGVQVVEKGSPFKTNLIGQVKFIASRLVKSLRFVWPAYTHALWTTHASISEWYRFGSDIIRGAIGVPAKNGASDSRADKCCVYVDWDIDYAIRRYGYSKRDVTAVGNPDLVQFGLSTENVGSGLSLPGRENSAVMYIDTGLIYTGTTFAAVEDFLQHLMSTRASLEEQGMHLMVKLHPEHFRTSFPAELNRAGIEICPKTEFVPKLQRCCAVIVEPSTVSLIPALMGIPVLLGKYGKLDAQQYGEVLTGYPRSRYLTDISEVNRLLAEERSSCDPERVKDWIAKNMGPLPATLMPDRVANILKAMVGERKLPEK